jgi:hypothetical protein
MATLTKKEVENSLKWADNFMKEELENLFATLEEVSKQDKEVFPIC